MHVVSSGFYIIGLALLYFDVLSWDKSELTQDSLIILNFTWADLGQLIVSNFAQTLLYYVLYIYWELTSCTRVKQQNHQLIYSYIRLTHNWMRYRS